MKSICLLKRKQITQQWRSYWNQNLKKSCFELFKAVSGGQNIIIHGSGGTGNLL